MSALVVEDDSDESDWLHEPPTDSRPRSHSISSTETVNYFEFEDGTDDAFFTGEVIDLTDDEPNTSRDHLRLGEAPLDHIWATCGLYIKHGDFLQVKGAKLGDHPVNFLRVELLVRDKNGQRQIRGVPFTRTRSLKGRVPKKLNEVCMITTLERREDSQSEREIFFDVSPHDVEKKRTLVVTNARYPVHSVDRNEYRRKSQAVKDMDRKVEEFGTIVCRWQLLLYYKVLAGRGKPDEEAIQHIQEESARDEKYRVADCAVRHHYRPESRPSSFGVYTVFDSFCGAGGVSRGALSAGFQIKYAIDMSPEV
ncbi:hypothetical protein K4F52_002850 [Lecanicillium sp. MT-2017a]|nr:hypothetical protein K4F52_002850 [Lecanicillium sp. MT-2017a]